MTDSLLDANTSDDTAGLPPSEAADHRDESAHPEGVPEKFWDPEKGALRSDALVKSYRELERKLGAAPQNDIPDSPEGYQVDAPNDLITADADVNARLHAAGFTSQQAQLVYDLAAEKLVPMVTEIAAVFEAEREIERLSEAFGGEDRWREASRQIAAWGRAHLPQPVFDALATTHDGVMAIHSMMTKEEPNLVRTGATSDSILSESSLKEMMRDPRYWRDHEPEYVRRVQDGFRRLFPE